MTRYLTVLVLSAAAIALSAGDAAAFGGRKNRGCDMPCAAPCAPACAPVHHCAAPCAPVVHCAAPMPAPCPMPCAPAPVMHHCAPACPAPCAPACCDPCGKPARMGLLQRLCNRNRGCGC